MSIVKPFRALRPPAEKAADVASVPYDVVSDAEVREITERQPHSFLRVTRPEADIPDDPSAAFDEAKSRLDKMIADGLLAEDNEPCFYIYRLIDGERRQTGIVGACAIDDYDAGRIRKHEKTRPDKVRDRTDHMLGLRAQTGLIFLAFRNTDEMRRLMADATASEPLYDFRDHAGVQQTVWRISDTAAIENAFAAIPELYVADGHHRAESASLARREMQAANPDHTGEEPYNFVMAGIFPSDDLTILAYNRLVKDLNGMDQEQFLARLAESFIVSKTADRVPAEKGNFAMYLGGQWYTLRHNMEYVREPGPLESLDAEVLQKFLLGPVLGIDDPRTNSRISFVGGGRGIDVLERAVDSGDAAVAFSMFPTSMNELFAVSDIDEIMPPKSTWFEPKLKDGLFVHLI